MFGQSEQILFILDLGQYKVMQAPPLRLFPHSFAKVQKTSNNTKNRKFFLV